MKQPFEYYSQGFSHFTPEACLQASIMVWLLREHPSIRRFTFASLGGLWQPSVKQKTIQKATGYHPGTHDVSITIPQQGYHGLYLELKAGKNKPTPEQIQVGQDLNEMGYLALFTNGWDETTEAIENYCTSWILSHDPKWDIELEKKVKVKKQKELLFQFPGMKPESEMNEYQKKVLDSMRIGVSQQYKNPKRKRK